MKELHRHLSDEEFLHQFMSKSLREALFTHEAHLRLTYLLLIRHGLESASSMAHESIHAYVSHLGAAHKFNLTVTLAGVRIVERYRKITAPASFDDLLASAPRLKSDFKGLIAEHYSRDVFSDAEARTTFLNPDKNPLL